MPPISKLIHNPKMLLIKFLSRNARFISNDKLFLRMRYRLVFGRPLNLDSPKTFNEKLQWLKLYNRKEEYTAMVDKYAVKRYVAEKIGEEHIIPTLGVWDRPEDIDFNALPDQFVLKTTNSGGGGGVVVCKDKKTFNKKKAFAKLKDALTTDIYVNFREWQYTNVRRRIIAEQFMVDDSGKELKDYKLFCFNGKMRFCKVDFNRFIDHHANYYSADWQLLPWGEEAFAPQPDHPQQRPRNFEKMIAIAETLAKDIPFVRIDFYNISGRIYFGEITFFPGSGFNRFTDMKADEEIGRLLTLPTKQ